MVVEGRCLPQRKRSCAMIDRLECHVGTSRALTRGCPSTSAHEYTLTRASLWLGSLGPRLSADGTVIGILVSSGTATAVKYEPVSRVHRWASVSHSFPHEVISILGLRVVPEHKERP
ncbi:hypothetical protein CALVIDRAFT_366917 [Calocera viscosa TUFC12733]|uniref:Uncharacterized protein n=1 Tax=Calocera viscosa (strain TUFC12733) TaxID=1330018 RepID=A0A167H1F7_CALVF|nr:hypothetical protein CALVIDRAFT_366917 [Calocera viscosa TUFC12733]